MRKGILEASLTIAVAAALMVCAACAKDGEGLDVAPSAGDIHEKCEKLWSDKKYDELDAYIDELVAKLPNYVPVKIADAMRYNRLGKRLEETVRILQGIEDGLSADDFIMFLPFMESLQYVIEDYALTAVEYDKMMPKDQRFRECDPRTNPKFGISRRFEGRDLFVCAPEIFIWDGKIIYAKVSRKSEDGIEKSVKGKSEEWLEECIVNDEESTNLRRACARVLTNRILEADGLEGLVKEFDDLTIYNMPWLSKLILERKTEALKAIRKCVDGGDGLGSEEQTLCICFLVAIESPEDEVIAALEAIRDAAEYDSVKALAEKAIDRIKNKKDGGDGKKQ